MLDWFKRLSLGRKFLVGWFALALPIGVFVLTDPNPTEGWAISAPFLFSFSLPAWSNPVATLGVAAVSVILLIWLWKILK